MPTKPTNPPSVPSGVYGGETITIAAFKDASTPKPAAAPPAPAKPASAATQAPAKPAPAPAKPAPAPAKPAPIPAKPTPPPVDPEDEEYERLPEGEGDVEELAENQDMEDDGDPGEGGNLEEFIDESNPFYVKKAKAQEAPAKQSFKDTSDAASDILRRLMDKKRSSR